MITKNKYNKFNKFKNKKPFSFKNKYNKFKNNRFKPKKLFYNNKRRRFRTIRLMRSFSNYRKGNRKFYLFSIINKKPIIKIKKKPIKDPMYLYGSKKRNFKFFLFFNEKNSFNSTLFEPQPVRNRANKLFRVYKKKFKREAIAEFLLNRKKVVAKNRKFYHFVYEPKKDKGFLRFFRLKFKNRRYLNKKAKLLKSLRLLKSKFKGLDRLKKRNGLFNKNSISIKSSVDRSNTTPSYKKKRLLSFISEFDRGSEKDLKHKIIRSTIGHLIRRGRKFWAEKVFLDSLFLLKKENRLSPIYFFSQALIKLRPTLGLRPKKKGGVIYRVPFLMKDMKQLSTAVFWLVNSAKQRTGRNSIASKLSEEIIDLFNNKLTSSFKKRDEMHKMALVNRSFLR